MKRSDQPDSIDIASQQGERWKRAGKPIFGIFISALVLTIAYWHDRGETLPPLDDIVTTDSIRIARGGKYWSGLWMICSIGPQIRLVLNTYLPTQLDRIGDGWTESLRADVYIWVDRTIAKHRSETKAKLIFPDAVWRRKGGDDILLTSPLPAAEIPVLSAAYLPTPPERLTMFFAEHGTEMRGVTDGNTISAFAKRCLASE
ncbi:hypothetical protein [Hoeflea alexandrii]|uniref:hypothetical protein n=1 Tax=Hoeflea alexandrii TaxID=288436 RepID=UPI0022AF65B1|nr:hypothetical protein [Hoeflea alexandrii]MCZ4289608.1 hypothetical protein [Hoeflea alexandrii]